ncbi:hypothetical protein C4579_03095 [Candidatus Microgenomates bacterium]|nr:MAG: hypothetical protein C4579_03095 [Candidatus Microgenomates bacterium]
MTIAALGLTVQTIGEVLVGLTAVIVHRRFWQEHKVNNKVYAEMYREQVFGIVGVVLIIMGYIIQMNSGVFEANRLLFFQ